MFLLKDLAILMVGFQDFILLICIIKGTWLEHQYKLIDFEDSSIHLYYNEVKIQVITVN